MWACLHGTPTCVFGGGAAEPYECCPAGDGRSDRRDGRSVRN